MNISSECTVAAVLIPHNSFDFTQISLVESINDNVSVDFSRIYKWYSLKQYIFIFMIKPQCYIADL